jgi:hypothetical protein
LYLSRALKWAYFSQHPDFSGLKVDEILARIKGHRYIICSDHFKTEDYIDVCDKKVKRLETGACPSIYGSTFNDTLGLEISPVQRKTRQTEARLVGLLSSQFVGNDSDSDSEFEHQDHDVILEEVNKRFEGRVTDDAPSLIDFIKCRSQVGSEGIFHHFKNNYFIL